MAWKRLHFSRNLPLSALFLYQHHNSTFSSVISIQQRLPQASRSCVIATGQGATQLPTLLSFPNSRLLIPRGPDDSTSISAAFSCVRLGGCGQTHGGLQVPPVPFWNIGDIPIAPNEHERLGRQNKGFCSLLVDEIRVETLSREMSVGRVSLTCCFWKSLSMGREAPAVNFICSCVNMNLLTFPTRSSVGSWHYVLSYLVL